MHHMFDDLLKISVFGLVWKLNTNKMIAPLRARELVPLFHNKEKVGMR
jgi:hypothetical protein